MHVDLRPYIISSSVAMTTPLRINSSSSQLCNTRYI